MDSVGFDQQRAGWIGSALGGVAVAGSSLGDTGAGEDPFDGPEVERSDTELVHLPRDRDRPDLRPRVGHKALANLEHDPLDVLGCLGGLRPRRPRQARGPGLIGGIVASHPLANPPVGAPEISCNLARWLPSEHPQHRLAACFLLGVVHARPPLPLG